MTKRHRRNDGEEREYVIYAEPPIDPRSHEMLLAQAESAGYVGKRVGDVIVQHAGTWQEQRWTVEEILPAVVYVFRDIMAEYEKRFEGEPFFVKVFKMSDEPSVKDFAPLVSQAHARKTRAEAVFKIYREGVLPLGFAAGMLGVSVADAMAGAMTADLGPLAVEWFDSEGHDASRAVARTASDVVLTRSALETLVDLDLLDVVHAQFSLIAPHSLLVALEHELLDAEEKCASGQQTVWSGDTGLRADEIPADDPSLRAAVERARRLFEWTRANVRAEFRPLETIHAPESEEEQVRQTIGSDSLDAVKLAQHFDIAMLADDLGLRRFVPNDGPGRTFCTVSLLSALAERGTITASERDRLLLRLVQRRYTLILPTRSLLTAALHPSESFPALAREAFALLGGPALDLPATAAIAAEVLRDVALVAANRGHRAGGHARARRHVTAVASEDVRICAHQCGGEPACAAPHANERSARSDHGVREARGHIAVVRWPRDRYVRSRAATIPRSPAVHQQGRDAAEPGATCLRQSQRNSANRASAWAIRHDERREI